jgi:hypothetical protein
MKNHSAKCPFPTPMPEPGTVWICPNCSAHWLVSRLSSEKGSRITWLTDAVWRTVCK